MPGPKKNSLLDSFLFYSGSALNSFHCTNQRYSLSRRGIYPQAIALLYTCILKNQTINTYIFILFNPHKKFQRIPQVQPQITNGTYHYY